VRARVGTENVRYVQGRFPESTEQISGDLRFCLVHIDCDLYEPIMAALAYFYPRLVPGGFMVIHDYSSLAWNGAERAVDEFFADKPEYVIPLPDGCGSAVVRRAVPAARTPVLSLGTWIKGGDAALADILGSGWSKPESWGVWGVGSTHHLVVAPARSDLPLLLELDCSAALPGPVSEQSVAVTASSPGGEAASLVWHFTRENNRSIRRLTLPSSVGSAIKISIAPDKPIRPSSYNPASADTRELGVALHRMRVVESAAR